MRSTNSEESLNMITLRELKYEHERDQANICVEISILYNKTLYCTQALYND
jgi:hypothetical protein